MSPADLVLVLTDSASTAAAGETVAAVLADGGVVVLTLQNGIGNAEALEAALPGRTVAVGSTYNSAACYRRWKTDSVAD
ncbi:MAG: hypothetical protein AcusKO_22840 [Acuticoccus sp.]